MGLFRKRQLAPEHKFEYINLRDFQDKSFVNVTAYIWIYLSILISLAGVAADTYTAITLLVFNRWSSQIQPVIPFETARIIFAVCILISYILIITDCIFAIRVIRGGGVADAYMNVIALRWNCVWGGKGSDDTGWRRFLVFARLTKQRGKTDYVALVTYFSFKGWVRIVFAEGPRVVINAFTLASVVSADLLPEKQAEALSAISKFFENIEHLYSENKIQVVILCSMTFTTILWIFAILQLLLACILFISFLWHVMHGDSLRKYCKDRIDKRMGEIVVDNHKKGIQKDNVQKVQAGILRAPTIPIPAAALEKPSYASSMIHSPVSANSTSNRMPQVQRQPTMPNMSDLESRRGTPKPLSRMPTSSTVASSVRPPMGRSQTIMSNSSYDSSFALISAQAGMGYGGQGDARGSTESIEYAERQQPLQQRLGSPPPIPSAGSASGYGYAGSNSGRSEGVRTPAPYAGSSSGRSEVGRTPAPYAGSISSRSEGGRTPNPREAPGYPMQDLHSPSSQNGRLQFISDRLARQQMQEGYSEMPPMSNQGQPQGQSQGQYVQRPAQSRFESGRPGYGQAQGRFPIAVKTRENQQRAPQGRFPIAVVPRDPQQQQYYNDGFNQGLVQSPQDYYSQEQEQQEERGEYYPQRQIALQFEQPQPYVYEYFPTQQQYEMQEQEQEQGQNYQQDQSRSQLPKLNTQTLGMGGYKRPTYTPASTTTAASQNSSSLPESYFPGKEDPVQMRSATAPPTRPQRAPLQQPQRSATARPDMGIRGPGDYERILPPARSATARPDDLGRRGL